MKNKKIITLIFTLIILITFTFSYGNNSNYIDSANKLASIGIINDNSLNPSNYNLGNKISRREMLKVMMNLSKKTLDNNCYNSFFDLNKNDWGCSYAENALKYGFISKNQNFRPNDNISKIESVKMIFQAIGIKVDKTSDWRVGYVEKGIELGIFERFNDYDTQAIRGWIFYIADRVMGKNQDIIFQTENEDSNIKITYSEEFDQIYDIKFDENDDLEFVGINYKYNYPRYLQECKDTFVGAQDYEKDSEYYNKHYKSSVDFCNNHYQEYGYKNFNEYWEIENNNWQNADFRNSQIREEKIYKYKNYQEYQKLTSYIPTRQYIPDDFSGVYWYRMSTKEGDEFVKGNKMIHDYLGKEFNHKLSFVITSKVEFSPDGKNNVFLISYITEEDFNKYLCTDKDYELYLTIGTTALINCIDYKKGENRFSFFNLREWEQKKYFPFVLNGKKINKEYLIVNGKKVDLDEKKLKYIIISSSTDQIKDPNYGLDYYWRGNYYDKVLFTNVKINNKGEVSYNNDFYFEKDKDIRDFEFTKDTTFAVNGFIVNGKKYSLKGYNLVTWGSGDEPTHFDRLKDEYRGGISHTVTNKDESSIAFIVTKKDGLTFESEKYQIIKIDR